MRKPALAALILTACGGTASPGFSTGPGVTSAPVSTSGNSTGRDTSTEAADDSVGGGSTAGSSTGVMRDVGASPFDMGPPVPPGCQGKVDLLFLISRLDTMVTEQEQLLASFPGFVDTIETKLEGFDVHIMVANPDGIKWPGWNCETYCNEDPQACAEWGYKCNDLVWDITPCDEALGAGLIFNGGGGAANRRCDLFGGNRYIISGEPNMDDALDCIARVGWSGAVPPMGDALLAAVTPQTNGEDGCNAGFLRKDALLVIVLISDVYDQESSSTPYQQYAAILAGKKDAGAVVMLGVVPQPSEGKPEVPGCTYDDDPGGNLRELIDMFPHRAYGNTCSSSYAPFFAEAVDLIEMACADYIPIPE